MYKFIYVYTYLDIYICINILLYSEIYSRNIKTYRTTIGGCQIDATQFEAASFILECQCFVLQSRTAIYMYMYICQWKCIFMGFHQLR